MTPDLLAGLLVTLLFGFVVILGLSCMNTLQGPSKFAKHYPPSSKEF